MKKCPLCRHKNPDPYNFCMRCGTSLPVKKTTGFKKRSLLAAALLGTILGSAGGGLLWVMNADSPKDPVLADTGMSSYQELIASAADFMDAGDLPKAEKNYLQANKLQPMEVLPYEKLYTIYTMQSEPEKAEDIKEKGEQNIPEEEKPGFNASIDKITEDAKPDPKWPVIADLGELDYTPITFEQSGWLLFQDGAYRFLLPDGTMQEAYGTDSVLVWDYQDDKPKKTACMMTTTDYSNEYVIVDGELVGGASCGAGGPMNIPFPYILKDDNTVGLTEEAQNALDNPLFGKYQDFTITDPIVVSHQKEAAGEYYIYLPGSEKLFGPYAESESSTFYTAAKKLPNLNFLLDRQKTSGPFYIHNPEEAYGHADGIQNRYSLMTEDGSRKLEGFSNAQAVDAFSIGGHKSTRFYSYDRDLNEVYNGLFEAGATAIDGVAPVKIDGVWKLISIDVEEEKNSENEDSSSTTSDKDSQNSESVSAPQEQPSQSEEPAPDPTPAPVADFSAFAGDYSQFSGTSSMQSFSIQPDGTFTASGKATYMGDTGRSDAKWTVSMSAVSGTLELVDGSRVRISSVQNEVPVGTSEVKNEMLIEYGEMGQSFTVGAEFELIPVGTPMAELSGAEVYQQIYGLEGSTLTQTLLAPEIGLAFLKS